MKFIEKMFSKKQVNEEIETLVGRHLLTLSRCTKYVAIASPSYGAEEYFCEVLVGASDLLLWAENHSERVWCPDCEDQAARKALPLWLRTADPTQDAVSYLVPSMFNVVKPYTLDFLEKGIAKVFCYECKTQVPYLNELIHNRKVLGSWVSWVAEWKCQNEHILYREKHEIHYHFRQKCE